MAAELGVAQHVHQERHGASSGSFSAAASACSNRSHRPRLAQAGLERRLGQRLEPDLAEAVVQDAALVIAVAIGVADKRKARRCL